MLDWLMIIPFSLATALCNRGAGGLWSQWFKTDLGDTGPRLLYGFIACLPVLFYLPTDWHTAAAYVAFSVVQGLLRGFGWHGSMDLGLTTSDKADFEKCAVMTACGLAFYAGLSGAVTYAYCNFALGLVFDIICAMTVLISYLAAARAKVEIPVLGCYYNDFPPFGELLSAFVIEALFCLFLLGVN